MNIELVVVRDPDGPVAITVFVDGVEHSATDYTVDAGADGPGKSGSSRETATWPMHPPQHRPSWPLRTTAYPARGTSTSRTTSTGSTTYQPPAVERSLEIGAFHGTHRSVAVGAEEAVAYLRCPRFGIEAAGPDGALVAQPTGS